MMSKKLQELEFHSTKTASTNDDNVASNESKEAFSAKIRDMPADAEDAH